MTLRKILAIAVIALVLPAAACNTVEGLGQDTQVAGEAVSDAAEDAKN